MEVLGPKRNERSSTLTYGFRPGRNPHQALDALVVGLERKKVNWVPIAGIRGFFDNMSREWTTKFIEHRVADRRILRLSGNGYATNLESRAAVRWLEMPLSLLRDRKP
jgi:retron-type reverse transcriptase